MAATLAPVSSAVGPRGGHEPAATIVLAVDVDQDAGTGAVDDLVDVATDLARNEGGEVRVQGGSAGLVSIEVPQVSAPAVSAELAAQPAAEDVHLPTEFSLWRKPADPLFRHQRSYLRQISVPRAWNLARGNGSTTIAVVDSGVSATHPDLRGRVTGTYNAVDGSRSVLDRIGHGTSVASVASATTNNRVGIAGVGWRTSILAVKVADASNRIFGDAIAAGIRWAVGQNADVINLSLGASVDDPMVREAVAEAVAAGVVVVAAVSNSGSTKAVYPASYPGVLAVGATQGRRLAPFSDRGRIVDVAAPGVGLRAAVPGGYARVDGTSFAAALVSGQAALVRSVAPGLSPQGVQSAIIGTTRPVGSGARAADRVQVFASVRRAIGTPTAPRSVTVAPRARAVVVRWKPPAAGGRSAVTSYHIELRRAGGKWSRAGVVDERRQRFLISGLRPGTRYQVRVVAHTGNGIAAISKVRGFRAR